MRDFMFSRHGIAAEETYTSNELMKALNGDLYVMDGSCLDYPLYFPMLIVVLEHNAEYTLPLPLQDHMSLSPT